MRAHIKDKEMRAALTPTYPVGAKRILFSDKYYAALARDNVELVRGAPAQINALGIADKQGAARPHDVIIYGTGFHTNPFLKSIEVRGEGGQTSIIFKLECQADYIRQLMKFSEKLGPLAVKADVEHSFNDELQMRLKTLVWNQVENSWYKDGTRLTNNWPGSSREYKKRTQTPKLSDFKVN